MKYEYLKELILTFNKSNLQNFSYKDTNLSINISKNYKDNIITSSYDEVACTTDENLTLTVKNDNKQYFIRSEYVAQIKTYNNKLSSYFVECGQYVHQGDILGFLKYLDVTLEITAPVSGIISEIKVNNNDMVEYGQTLFIISICKEK